MANLNENTQYNANGTQSNIANLSNIMKGLQNKSTTSSADTVKSAITSHFNPALAASIFSPGAKTVRPTNDGAFPLGKPIGQQVEGLKNEPIPGYEQFLETDPAGKWVAPSSSATLRNWPTSLGGGQYVTDPTQPGKLIKSQRVLWDENQNPGGKKAVLGKKDSRFFQVDHIVPLWIGGADTAANSEILDVTTHERKTAVQSVPLTLLANGKIDLNQAKIMALTWKDKDTRGLPSADENGYVPLDVAEKFKQKWENDISHPSMWKYFGESFKENMANFGEGWLPDPIREFGKGLVGGGTAGIVPGTQASEDSGTIGTVANMAGNIVGTITGLGLLTKGVVKVLGGTKAVLGIKNAVTIADEATKSAGLVTDIGKVAKSASKARVETLSKMAKSAGLLSLWGQIGVTGREVTGQEDAEFKTHVKQFMTDVAFGSLLGSAGQTMKGYATVGLGTTSISLMGGADIVTAVQDGALMTALHGLAYKKGIVDPKVRIGNEEAYKMAATTFNQYVGPEFNTIKRGQPVPTVLTFDAPKIEKIKTDYKAAHPNDTRFDNVSDTGGAVQILGRTAKSNFLDTVKKSDGTISQDQISKEMKRITVAENQLYNQTLEPVARQNKEWQDLLSMGEKLRPQTKSSQFPQAKNQNEILNKIPEVPTKLTTTIEEGKYPTGKSGITGYGGNLDAEAKFNVDDFAKNPSNYDGKIYIPKTDQETASIMRLLQQEQIASGQSIGNPDKTLRAFVKTIDGEFKPIGYVPQEKSFDIKRDNLNKTYQIITTRLQQIRKSAKTPEAMMNYYNADKAGIKMDIKTAEELFARRAEKISDEELYSILKPTNAYSKLDSSLNNEALYDQMDRLNLEYLVVDPFKAWEINGQRPRWNPENPYASIEITSENWAQSIEMNKIGKLTPIEDAIKKVTEQLKATELAKTTRSITNRPQQELPLPKEAINMPVEAPRMPVEAPLATKTSITPELVEKLKKLSPKEKYKNITTVVSKAPEVKSVGRFESLIERGKLTPEEAKPYIEKENRLKELNRAAEDRVLEYSEIDEITKIAKDLNNFLDSRGLIRKAMPVKQYVNYKKVKENNINDLLNDAMIRAEGSIDMIKGQKATSSPDTFDQAVKGAIQGAKSLITNNKLGLTSAEQREVNIEFNKRIQNLIQTKSDQSFEGSPNLSGQNYDPKLRQFTGWDPVRGVDVIGKGKSNELSLKEENWLKDNQGFNDKTIQKIKDSLTTKEKLSSENADQKLARLYGLELKPDGYLKLNKKGEPLFEPSSKTDSYGRKNGKTPLQFWGSLLEKDLAVNNKIKTLQSEKLVEGFNIMSKAPNTYGTFGDVVNKLLKKIVVEPQEKWLQDKMGSNPGKSFTFNSMMNSRSNYMKRLFETTNTSGHTMSQPIERIIAKVEGASPEKISEIDRNTIKKEQESALARAERGSSGNEESISSLSKDNILSEGISAEDLKGLSVKDTFQMQKLQDLTNFEMRFPSFLYEEVTGKTPPKAAVVDDAISFIKDFLSNYNKNIKTGGKIKKAPYINKQEWEKIKGELLGEKKLDGKGGFWGKVTDAITKPMSSTITYNRADYFPEEFANKAPVTKPVQAPKPVQTKEAGLSGFFKKKPVVMSPTTYNVRGINVSDNDIKEASDILYGEISNRNPERQAAEVKYAINTAINRANANPKKYGGSIVNVLKEPAQYQSYAPQGIKKDGKVVESQYQKLKKGEIDEAGKKKLETIISALNEMKSGSFPDTAGGKTFYVHASDGTMWLGKTQDEAKNLANAHERAIKTKPTNWNTVAGFPNGASRGF